jgi:cytochrome c-type biogenesis protein CcmH
VPNARHLLGRRIVRAVRLAVAVVIALTVALVLAPAIAQAREATPTAADPALEARVMALADELRCVVCQNETLAASQADLARDLRAQIRLQLQQGRSHQEVLDFMVERYGQFVLYRPPLQISTLVLWVGPFLLLAIALAWWIGHTRRRRRDAGGLSPDEIRRVQALLDGDPTR